MPIAESSTMGRPRQETANGRIGHRASNKLERRSRKSERRVLRVRSLSEAEADQ